MVSYFERELRKNVDRDKLKAATGTKYGNDRVGEIAYLFHDGIMSSPVATYRGLPYWFTGQIWEPVSETQLESAVFDTMRHMGVSEGDIVLRGSRMFRICIQAVGKKELRVWKNLVCFRNCVLDVDTGVTYNFSPRLHVTYQLPYDYDPKARAPLWGKFLREVLPEESRRKVLQEYLGLLFVDRRKAKIESMLFLLGTGSNGKSVVFETITGILGRDNVSNYELSALTTGSERLKNLAVINGKMVNYCSEISKNEVSSSYAKALISGEPQQARMMFGQPFTAYNIPLLIANANQMPFSRDCTHGFFRRLLIIPFGVEIPPEKQDKELAARLVPEYPGIFNWIIDGRRRITAAGYRFSYSPDIEDALNDYRSDSNPILLWLSESGYLHRLPGKLPTWVPSFDLYTQGYIPYAVRFGLERFNLTVFGRTLSNLGYRKRRTGQGTEWAIFKTK